MKKKILAIDDSLSLREFIQRSLMRHSADYTIILAKDGTEGLRLCASEQPDLILLDFVLPDMKGDEVCRQLQSEKLTDGLPVVLMSSSVADTRRAQNEFENVIKAIAKPFTPELLCSTVAHSFWVLPFTNRNSCKRMLTAMCGKLAGFFSFKMNGLHPLRQSQLP